MQVGVITSIMEFIGTAGAGFAIDTGAMYRVMKRRIERLTAGPPSNVEARVELLENELAASRTLVEQLSEGRRFENELRSDVRQP